MVYINVDVKSIFSFSSHDYRPAFKAMEMKMSKFDGLISPPSIERLNDCPLILYIKVRRLFCLFLQYTYSLFSVSRIKKVITRFSSCLKYIYIYIYIYIIIYLSNK